MTRSDFWSIASIGLPWILAFTAAMQDNYPRATFWLVWTGLMMLVAKWKHS